MVFSGDPHYTAEPQYKPTLQTTQLPHYRYQNIPTLHNTTLQASRRDAYTIDRLPKRLGAGACTGMAAQGYALALFFASTIAMCGRKEISGDSLRSF